MTSEEDYDFKRLLINLVSVSIILVLALVLINRIQRESRALEQANFKLRLAEIRAMLLVKNAELVAMGNSNHAADWNYANPIEWMKEPPGNYDGLAVLGADSVEKGHWIFDAGRRALVYRIEYPGQIIQQPGPDSVPGWLRFQVQLKQGGSVGLNHLSLVAKDDYTWITR